MDHWTPWNPFGHPDPEYAGHAYFHPSLEGVTTLTAFLVPYSLRYRKIKRGVT